jgi:hypothetical protein
VIKATAWLLKGKKKARNRINPGIRRRSRGENKGIKTWKIKFAQTLWAEIT